MSRLHINHNKKIIISVIVSVVVLASAGLVLFALYSPYSKPNSLPNQSINYNPPTDAQKKAGDTVKRDVQKSSDTNNGTGPSSQPGSKVTTVGLTITATNQDATTFYIRTQIGTVTTAGNCTLTLSRRGYKTYTSTVGVSPLAETSTCQGFNIPLNNLFTGTWTAAITYSSSDMYGSDNQTVNVK